MKENIEISVKEGITELILREGHALPAKEPNYTREKGNILAPFAWAAVRHVDPILDNLRFSRKEMKIVFTKNERDPYFDQITGTLQENDDLAGFGINAGKMWTTAELAKFLKMNRLFFADYEECAKMVTELNALKAKVQTEIEAAQDDRGNKKQLRDTKVDSNVPMKFTLNIAAFVGFSKNKFVVEICMEATDRSLQLWLESAELNEIVIEGRDRIIDEEVEKFRKTGLPIIEY